MTTLRAAVLGGPGPATEIAEGLRHLGAIVADHFAPPDPAVPLRLVVWAPAPGAAATRLALLDHDARSWDAEAAQPLRDAVACFQQAADALVAGGSIVAVLPTLAMSGAAGLTAWATAAEGLRSLVKVAAREFGSRGITVNTVALPAKVLAGHPDSLDRPGLPAARLPIPVTAAGEVAGIIAALAAPPWDRVTGATIAVDGGVWMPA